MKCEIEHEELLTKNKEVKQRPKGLLSRWNDVKGAYSCVSSCNRKMILLLDDVTTSGATLSECADMLIKEGAELVFAIVAARDAPRY